MKQVCDLVKEMKIIWVWRKNIGQLGKNHKLHLATLVLSPSIIINILLTRPNQLDLLIVIPTPDPFLRTNSFTRYCVMSACWPHPAISSRYFERIYFTFFLCDVFLQYSYKGEYRKMSCTC